MNNKLPKDVIEQIQRTDLHYKLNVENISIEEVLSMDNNLRIGILKSWGEIMETYLKAILRANGETWSTLRNKSHNLKAIYKALDDDSKKLFEILIMGRAREFVDMLNNDWPKVAQAISSIEGQLNNNENIPDMERGPRNKVGTIERGGNDNALPQAKKKRKALSARQEYTLSNIINMIDMIKVASFRYAGGKNINFNDDFMVLMYDAVKAIHKIANIGELQNIKSADNKR